MVRSKLRTKRVTGWGQGCIRTANNLRSSPPSSSFPSSGVTIGAGQKCAKTFSPVPLAPIWDSKMHYLITHLRGPHPGSDLCFRWVQLEGGGGGGALLPVSPRQDTVHVFRSGGG